MNELAVAHGTVRPWFTHIRFTDGFDVCWAGPHPRQAGFCFGSEDGRLLFTDEAGASSRGPVQGSPSGEAINGVAGIGEWLAVTTRAEVTFGTLSEPTGKKSTAAVFGHGAYGVTATPGGSFLAPLGRTGIMAVKPPLDDSHPVTVFGGAKETMNFYRCVTIGSYDGEELFVCAGRRGGIGAMQFQSGQESHRLSTISFATLDVVDLCALSVQVGSVAVAALGRDGTLIFFRDVWNERKPVTLKYDTIQGVAYRIMSCRGHLFVLTSEGMYVIAKLADRFMAGESIESFTSPMIVLPMAAVDANLVGDRWLLIVMPDEVRKFDVGLIHDNVPDDIGNGEIREFVPKGLGQVQIRNDLPRALSPDWERHLSEQMNTQLAGKF